MSLYRKKLIIPRKTEMKRHLGVMDLILLGLGSMVGTGIFTITGIGAANYAGPALVISIVLAAIAVGISALFSAEFASRIPTSGGVYGYIYATLGEFPAWMGAWFMMSSFLMAIASVASGWASYLKGLLGYFNIQIPQALNGTFNPEQGTYIDLLPVLVLIAVTGLVLLNSKSALKFNGSLVILKFSALILFIVLGIFYINPENWQPFAPYGFGNGLSSQSGILPGAALMFFAFLGYESISTAVDETKEPQKNVPKGIVLSIMVVTFFYIVLTLILTGLVHYTKLNVEDAVAFALRQVGLTWAANYISVVAILTLITVCISMTFALARIIYSISLDGLLPKSLQKLSEKSKVPTNATLVTGILAMIGAGFMPLEAIAKFVNISTFAYLILMAVALLALRRNQGQPQADQFKTPLVPFLPILSIIISLIMVSQYELATWLIFLIASVFGLLIYGFYGYKHSNLAKK